MSPLLFVCRHGERIDDVDPQWKETANEPWDPPLTERGREQIRRSIQRISEVGLQYIIASPMRRTVESAEVASSLLGLRFIIDDGLVEWQNPDWFPRLTTGNPIWLREASNWSGIRVNSVPPSFPETEDQAKARCAAAARLLVTEESRDGLIIAHENGAIGIVNGLTGTVINSVGFGGLLEFSLSHRGVRFVRHAVLMNDYILRALYG